MSRKTITPKYRLHRPSGRAVATFNGKDHYLGKHGSPESEELYKQKVGQWLMRGRQTPGNKATEATNVRMLCAGFIEQGKIEKEFKVCQHTLVAIRWLEEMYGSTKVADFGPLDLKALRSRLVTTNVKRPRRVMPYTLTRTYINQLINRIQIMFRWGASVGLVPASTWHALTSLRPLMRGRGNAREGKTVGPVDQKHVDAVLELASPQTKAMIQLQLLTGMRSEEMTRMRTVDINRHGPPIKLDDGRTVPVWWYTPQSHKTEHHGKKRIIPMGPEAQGIITPFLKLDLTAALFSTVEGYRNKVRIQPKHPKGFFLYAIKMQKRRRCRPFYTSQVWYNTLRRLNNKADEVAHLRNPHIPKDQRIVEQWHPHQLRHNAATFLTQRYGIENARIMLGHTSVSTTQIYAERDLAKMAKIAAEVG